MCYPCGLFFERLSDLFLFNRFMDRLPWPWLAITSSVGAFVIALLVGYIIYATFKRIARVEDDYQEMMELKKRAEAADVAKSQVVSLHIRAAHVPVTVALRDQRITFLS